MADLGVVGIPTIDVSLYWAVASYTYSTRQTLTRSPCVNHGLIFSAGAVYDQYGEPMTQPDRGKTKQITGTTALNSINTPLTVHILYKGGLVREFVSTPVVSITDLVPGEYEVTVYGDGTKRSETWGYDTVVDSIRLALSGTLDPCSSGVVYASSLTTVGGNTLTWDIGADPLPTGLSFSTSTGEISGTTTQTGTYKLTIGVRDNDGYRVYKDVTLTVT